MVSIFAKLPPILRQFSSALAHVWLSQWKLKQEFPTDLYCILQHSKYGMSFIRMQQLA